MGSQPWKQALIARFDRDFSNADSPRVRVTTPGTVYGEREGDSMHPTGEKTVAGRYVGSGRRGSTVCIIVNTASEEQTQEWKALSREERGRSDYFSRFERWIPLVQGVNVEAEAGS